MIWLSVASEQDVVSVYFDIRHIELTLSESGPAVLVRGVLGDGYCENWGEVSLGKTDKVAVLPCLNESGAIERLTSVADEEELQQEMLIAVYKYVKNSFSVIPQRSDDAYTEWSIIIDPEERIAA